MKFYKLTFYPEHPKNVKDIVYETYAYKDIIETEDWEKEVYRKVANLKKVYDLGEPDAVKEVKAEEVKEMYKGNEDVEDFFAELEEEEEEEESVE